MVLLACLHLPIFCRQAAGRICSLLDLSGPRNRRERLHWCMAVVFGLGKDPLLAALLGSVTFASSNPVVCYGSALRNMHTCTVGTHFRSAGSAVMHSAMSLCTANWTDSGWHGTCPVHHGAVLVHHGAVSPGVSRMVQCCMTRGVGGACIGCY
ncbi:hypothetical protein COO60DRAFT_268576 [Scenedesmus sp. NREL 46B-D3]|nr:hypothetical protein COO60DRAFT_268576 [Scenedesmus sp. NREL 46B-D3]